MELTFTVIEDGGYLTKLFLEGCQGLKEVIRFIFENFIAFP